MDSKIDGSSSNFRAQLKIKSYSDENPKLCDSTRDTDMSVTASRQPTDQDLQTNAALHSFGILKSLVYLALTSTNEFVVDQSKEEWLNKLPNAELKFTFENKELFGNKVLRLEAAQAQQKPLTLMAVEIRRDLEPLLGRDLFWITIRCKTYFAATSLILDHDVIPNFEHSVRGETYICAFLSQFHSTFKDLWQTINVHKRWEP